MDFGKTTLTALCVGFRCRVRQTSSHARGTGDLHAVGVPEIFRVNRSLLTNHSLQVIRRNYEEMEAQKTQLMIAVERQRVVLTLHILLLFYSRA